MIIGINGHKQSGKNTVGEIIRFLLSNFKLSFRDWISLPEDYKIRYSKVEQKAFAFKVKQILSIITGISIEDMEKEEVKNTKLPEHWAQYSHIDFTNNKQFVTSEYDKMVIHLKKLNENILFDVAKISENPDDYKVIFTIRQALQYIGTDMFRELFHENTWVNALMTEYKNISPCDREPDGFTHPNWAITDVRFLNEVQAIKNKGGILIKIENNKTIKDIHSSETSLNDYKEFDYTIQNNGTIDELIKKVRIILNKENLLKDN